MPLINPLPFIFANGEEADGTQVNADFEALVSDLNDAAVTQPPGTNNDTLATTGFVQQELLEAFLTAIAYKGAALYSPSVPVNVGTNNLVFSELLVDTNNISSGLSNLTVPAGVSIVRLTISAVVTGGGTTAMSVNKNGTVYIPGIVFGGEGVIELNAPVAVIPGDIFTISVTQTGGSTTINFPTTFEMQIIG